MHSLVAGILIGLLLSSAAWGVAAYFLHKRFLLLERRTQQAERLAELGTLTGGLAHEIKNPLSTVQLNLQLLAEDLPPESPGSSRLSSRLKTVQRETSRLKDILDDFLRYAGKLELDLQPTDVNQMIEELVDFFSPQAQLQRVQLRFRPSSEKLVVPLDSRLIKQAVLNLMLNGLQAMGSDGGEMILSTSRRDGEALIEVIDTGPGIAAEVTERIFQAYYSTKQGGTGLGLAMARRIIHEHGGRITIKSDLGKGTAFTLHLPEHGSSPAK